MTVKKPNSSKGLGSRQITKKNVSKTLLTEIAWEVCNQVGGIYTVIRSKVPSMIDLWGENYCLIGPYVNSSVNIEYEIQENPNDPFYVAAKRMQDKGFEVYYGRWLVSGRPKAILVNPHSIIDKLGEIKFGLWENHGIETPDGDFMLNDVLTFGFMVKLYLAELANEEVTTKNIIAHFHEWMAGTPIPDIRKENIPITTVFTTHATLLGRYLAMNDPLFYDYLGFYDWQKEAKHFNIEANVKIERAAAHGSHVFTTVSEVTAAECKHLLGREIDVILPNGLNIERFTAMHEVQNLHQNFKEMIHEFVMGHFFQSYAFDLDNTLYFFTSGRFEYHNKGFDLTLEALARLNWKMKEQNIDTTVVMFYVTKRPFHSINPSALQSRAMMKKIRDTCEAIEKQVGDKLFYAAAISPDLKLPSLNEFVDDYWRLRLRRTLQSWKSNSLPLVVTHNLVDDQKDPLLNFVRESDLINKYDDRVKIVYHPDFIQNTNPLFGIDYDEFVRGCHLGVFPSYYEPWGYTPLECIARGVPTVTSDLSGFGDYVLKNMEDYENNGISVINRRYRNYDEAANQLCDYMLDFVKQNRRDRILERNRVERASELFDWHHLTLAYDRAYSIALERLEDEKKNNS
ncbi:glycosyltransferase [Flammeovirgaceae bacterium SG7u.111]|nr:glycosyltransferase [Flammeovirgaceae bacterium SG7u.132]WPO36219.1 glycosyltransferase [Flammeovirgaceae bacterium SG7u.111]